ncbi:MAG TPA: S9 family peptidase [Steroidobacteraceae bacterium]|jgi:dipeptidyl aminopeptidase/acylaminoacyl peptidase
MPIKYTLGIALVLAATTVRAENPPPFDAAAAFGARPSVLGMSLSPDGKRVAYVAPMEGQGAALLAMGLENGAHPKAVTYVNGKSDQLGGCSWVANDRLICTVYGVAPSPMYGLLRWSRLFAIDADGKNSKMLSTQEKNYSRGLQLNGGRILDWLPDENGSVLMERQRLPDDHLGTRLGSSEEGRGVDRIDTRTLTVTQVERPSQSAMGYLSDGRGTVRIMALRDTRAGYDTGAINFLYREKDSREWKGLVGYDSLTGEGFDPIAIDHDLNVVYGLKKKDGRRALYTLSLDGSKHEDLVYSRPDVDISGTLRIGRRQRVIGASYVTDTRQSMYLSPDIQKLLAGISKALPGMNLRVADSSVDENTLLIFAGSDADPGVYYIFDRKAHQLNTFLIARDQLEGVKLAKVKAITYPADDGVNVPAYLTLPPGREDAKGLPAIVLPHGGPSARDEWGFDWLSQFYANRGFAVLQPNFRGSSGYGDAWFQENGFRSWPVAVGDILAAGHWLVKQGIANSSKLAVVGWSYGGYAALQSAVVDSQTFKAVIAIAPVTDLPGLKEDSRYFTDFEVVSKFVGEGPHMHEGSPSEHADKIKVPVLLFHGAMDTNVHIQQSQRMQEKLQAAGARSELITWADLDHQLDDSAARTQMLRKSEAFLRAALGM